MKLRHLSLLLALIGCVDQPTQVLVRLATDIHDIDTVVINIYDDEGALVREQVLPPDRLAAVPDDGRFHPIGTFGLVPQDDDPNRRFRVVVDVTVRREGTVRFETRARSGFVKDNTIRLDIFIAELCIDLAAMCEEEGLTCGIDGCVPEDIPPESLPPIDDDPIPDDPIDPRRHDAGVVLDSGFDSAVDSAIDGPVDAPVDVAFDAATDTMGIDVGFFDGGPDGGMDAAFDGGMDAGGFDGGVLVPGMDDAPVIFPWAGFRFEDGQPHVAFREIPTSVRYAVTLRDFPAGTVFREEFIAAGAGTGILDTVLTGITGLPRRAELQVRSCDGPDPILDCNAPLARPRYIDLGRVRCDVDDDGESEVIATQSNGTLNVWTAGPGAARQTITPNPGTGSTVAACADLDGDGDAEIVSLQAVNGQVGIVDWTGATLVTRASPFMATATSIIAADFDSDGFEDVVFADVNNGTVRYARGMAGPSLGAPTSIARDARLAMFAPTAPGRFGRDLAVTDENADGYPDIIIADANHVDDVTKIDSGLQICYGGPTPFVPPCTHVAVPAAGEVFGFRVAGLGVSASGRGGFVVAAPEAGAGNTGRVYEYRNGAAMPVPVDSPAMGDGFCCFPSDLTPGPRDYDAYAYYAGYAGWGGDNSGRVYRCADGTCTTITPPGRVVDSFFGFDVMGDFSGDRLIALSRGAQNGVYVLDPTWMQASGLMSVNDLSRLAE